MSHANWISILHRRWLSIEHLAETVLERCCWQEGICFNSIKIVRLCNLSSCTDTSKICGQHHSLNTSANSHKSLCNASFLLSKLELDYDTSAGLMLILMLRMCKTSCQTHPWWDNTKHWIVHQTLDLDQLPGILFSSRCTLLCFCALRLLGKVHIMGVSTCNNNVWHKMLPDSHCVNCLFLAPIKHEIA